jgi:SAM-dependent methyltransferase
MPTARAALSVLLAPSYDSGDFDRQFGTDTTSFVSVSEGGVPSELQNEAGYYSPAVEPVVHRLIRALPIRGEEFTFIDVGAGKGRVLLLASLYPFAKIIGVELSPLTARIAEDNIERFRETAEGLQKCHDVEIRRENALDFEIPDANVVLFLFNPFQGSILTAFVRRVEEFVASHRGRRVLLAYVNPASVQPLVSASGAFRQVAELRVINPSWSWIVWEAGSADLGAAGPLA